MAALKRLWRLSVAIITGLVISACGSSQTSTPPEAFQPQAELSAERQERYDNSCAICHGVAGTGAPAAGDMSEWELRGQQGMEALLDHAISGYRGMPPMGMCMECTQEDLQAMIQYMSGLECE